MPARQRVWADVITTPGGEAAWAGEPTPGGEAAWAGEAGWAATYAPGGRYPTSPARLSASSVSSTESRTVVSLFESAPPLPIDVLASGVPAVLRVLAQSRPRLGAVAEPGQVERHRGKPPSSSCIQGSSAILGARARARRTGRHSALDRSSRLNRPSRHGTPTFARPRDRASCAILYADIDHPLGVPRVRQIPIAGLPAPQPDAA